jgi:hypothetical protein
LDLEAKNWRDMEEMMSPVPQLPRISNLTIDAQWQHLEASIAKLIAKCTRIERLSIDISRPVSPINLFFDIISLPNQLPFSLN